MSTQPRPPFRGAQPPRIPPPAAPAPQAAPAPLAAASDDQVGGIAAYGTLIQVLSDPGPPEVYTTIEGVGDITGPGNQLDEIDVTSHSTGVPIKQVIPGLIDLGELAFPCYWIPSDPTQNINSPFGLEYLFFTRTVTKFQLVNTDPTRRTRQFRGFVKTMGEDAKVTGVMTRNVSIRITSPWTDVASPIALVPDSVSAVPAAGAPTGTIEVQTGGSNAPWNAVPSAPWITITTPTGPQMGDGTITYAVAENLGTTARNGTINVTGLGLTFTIAQLAGS